MFLGQHGNPPRHAVPYFCPPAAFFEHLICRFSFLAHLICAIIFTVSEPIRYAKSDEIARIARALDSPLRLRMIEVLSEDEVNVNQLGARLEIPQSTCTTNLKILEEADLVETRIVPAESKGVQKMCSLKYDKVLLPLLSNRKRERRQKAISTDMPIGLFNDFSISAPCGILNDTGLIGYYDSETSFLHPSRASAGIIWFTYGYLEYRFPKNFKQSDKIKSVKLSAEVCSEYPGHNDAWPSDITVWINGIDIGKWTSPGDNGGKRGLLTPEWVNINDSQFGFLKTWKVDHTGSYCDKSLISYVKLRDLHIADNDSIKVRIGVKKDAANRGGINLFGSRFGNFEQDLRLTVEFE